MSMRSARVLAAVAGLGVAMPAAGQSIPWLNPVNGNWNEAAKWTGGNIPDAVGEIARLNVAGTYTVTQNVGGLTLSSINISAPNATLHLIGHTMTLAGTAGLTNSGTVVNVGGNSLINGAVNNNASGDFAINPNTAITLNGNLLNNGVITVNPAGNNSFGTTLAAGGPVVISGSGSILLNGSGSAGHLSGPGTFENGATHLIHGRGQITGPLTNQGAVTADQPGQTLNLFGSPMTNNGTFLATSGATMAISGIAVTQGASGVIEADAGTVNLVSATISGGTLTTVNAGFIGSVSGTTTLVDVLNTGDLFINPNCAIGLGGSTFTNEGTFVVNTNGNNSFGTTLNANAPMLIEGAGEIILNANTSAAQITSSTGAIAITQGPNHMISGRGQITAPMINHGIIIADVNGGAMVLNSNSKTNNASIVASNNAVMAISGIAITQTMSGAIIADGGFVDLTSATINGGTVDGRTASGIRGVSGTQTLSDVNFAGSMVINPNTAVALAGGAFINNGSIVVNTTANNSFSTTLAMSGDVTISGMGDINLNAHSTAAQITGNTLTLGGTQLIHGRGQIVAPMINEGRVLANIPGGAMSLNTNSKVNNFSMGATNGGVLSISSIAINQAPAATIMADGGFVDLSAATVNGGNMESVNGGRHRGVGSTQTLSDVNLDGDLDLFANTAVVLTGGAFTNNGSVLVNSTGNNSFSTTLTMGGDVAIDGTGEIILNASNSAAQITGSILTLGSGQTIRGRGQIVAPLVNNGLVHANVAGNAMALNTSNKTNHAVMRVSNTGVMAVSGITITQSPSGVIEADNGFVDLSSASITGGSIDALNGGRFRGVGGTQTLTDLATSGPIDLNANTAIVLVGTLLHDGSFVVNAQANNSFATTLQMNGPVTLLGNGEIFLNASGEAARITQSGGSLTMGPGQTLRGVGNIASPITLQGTIAPGRSVGTLNVPSATTVMTYEPGSTYAAELGSAAAYDRVTGGSHTINGGTVAVTLVDGYTPALFTKHTIIDGSGASVLTGAFDAVTGPALPAPWVWKVGYTAQDAIVGVTCPSDINADFIVDIVDFLDFLDSFGSCENQPAPCGNLVDADYNGDTFVDILDFLEFFDAFGSGC